MPFAADNHVSTDPIDGGIEISEAQYQAALAAMTAGRRVTIEGGAFAIVDPPPAEPPPEEPPAE